MSITGQSLWFYVKLLENGCVQWRNSHCGDEPNSRGHTLLETRIFKCAETESSVLLSSIRYAMEYEMTSERKQHFLEK